MNDDKNNNDERSVSIEARASLLSDQLNKGLICIIICACLIYYSTNYGLLGILLAIAGSLVLIFIFGIIIYSGLKLNKQLIDAVEKEPPQKNSEDQP